MELRFSGSNYWEKWNCLSIIILGQGRNYQAQPFNLQVDLVSKKIYPQLIPLSIYRWLWIIGLRFLWKPKIGRQSISNGKGGHLSQSMFLFCFCANWRDKTISPNDPSLWQYLFKTILRLFSEIQERFRKHRRFQWPFLRKQIGKP